MVIRLIKKKNHKVIDDIDIDLPSRLSFTERPAYISVDMYDQRKEYEFAYIGSTESSKKVTIPNIGDVSVGVNSGRLVTVSIGNDVRLNENERNACLTQMTKVLGRKCNKEALRSRIKLLSEILVKTK